MSKNDRSKTTGVVSPVDTRQGGSFRLEAGDGRSNWTLIGTATDWDTAQATAQTRSRGLGKPVRIIGVDGAGGQTAELAVYSRGNG